MDAEVTTLLALKADYKAATGKDWKPGAYQPAAKTAPATQAAGGNADDLNEKITEQGNKVRKMKADKATKVCILFMLLVSFHLSPAATIRYH